MKLLEYACCIYGLSVPSGHQIASFVDYTCRKHSWYKHLPLTFPGATFCFFMSPFAGLHCHVDSSGRPSYREIAPEDCFHHAMLSTAVYRSRFGYLDVLDVDAPDFVSSGPAGASHFGSATHVRLPAEIIESGSVNVTGIIHPRSRMPWVWKQYFEMQGNAILAWPEQSGGMQVLRSLRTLSYGHGRDVEEEIDALIGPERQRQIGAMLAAVERIARIGRN